MTWDQTLLIPAFSMIKKEQVVKGAWFVCGKDEFIVEIEYHKPPGKHIDRERVRFRVKNKGNQLYETSMGEFVEFATREIKPEGEEL